MPTNFRLITIPVSHYSEKARWALDYLKVPFQELAHMPPFHRGATKKYGGTSVPVLVTATGVATDSTDILRYLDRLYPEKLYPAEPELQLLSMELENLFNRTLGVHTRRWGYSYILTPKLLYPRWTLGVPFWEKLLFPVIFPKVGSIVRQSFDITETSAAESYQEITGVFDRVSHTLSDGRKYLLGERFSAIDITFAALAAPILQPPEHHIPPPSLELMPDRMQVDIRNCRATPAGEFGLRLYRDNRYY
ncbi:MAG: glutathione S-transferase [Chamaesiphon sp.]|nr:glutathione S-transferase [Chamaesiphon sp.]